MKVLPFKIPKPEHDALIYQEDKEMVFYDKFHQHEEIQISYIAEGEGTLVVGDTINYTITVENTGGETLSNMTLVDTLTDANASVLSLTTQPTFVSSTLNSDQFHVLIPKQ